MYKKRKKDKKRKKEKKTKKEKKKKRIKKKIYRFKYSYWIVFSFASWDMFYNFEYYRTQEKKLYYQMLLGWKC